MADYYNPEDLKKFSEIGKSVPELWEKFGAYYGAVFESCSLTKREKCLIADPYFFPPRLVYPWHQTG